MDAAVVDVLQRAGSQDPSVFKPAEQTLREWETQRGFYTALFVSWIDFFILYVIVFTWDSISINLGGYEIFKESLQIF